LPAWRSTDMALPFYTEISVYSYNAGAFSPVKLSVNAEYPVAVFVNGEPVATIACSGADVHELAVGFLMAEGIIKGYEEISALDFNEDTLTIEAALGNTEIFPGQFSTAHIVTGGGRAKRNIPPKSLVRKNNPTVDADVICRAIDEFLHSSAMHELTHGVHSAALYRISGEKIIFYDEIGRHNAIDKVIGRAAMNSVGLDNSMLLSTGRISSEIAMKVIQCGVPVFISRASPTDYAASLLKEYNVVSLCRAHEDRFLIINGRENIVRTSS